MARKAYPPDLTSIELVDTMGLVLMVVVPAANIQDRDGAKLVLEKVLGRFPRLKLIWADGGYSGKLIDWVREQCQWVLEIVKRSDQSKAAAAVQDDNWPCS